MGRGLKSELIASGKSSPSNNIKPAGRFCNLFSQMGCSRKFFVGTFHAPRVALSYSRCDTLIDDLLFEHTVGCIQPDTMTKPWSLKRRTITTKHCEMYGHTMRPVKTANTTRTVMRILHVKPEISHQSGGVCAGIN